MPLLTRIATCNGKRGSQTSTRDYGRLGDGDPFQDQQATSDDRTPFSLPCLQPGINSQQGFEFGHSL